MNESSEKHVYWKDQSTKLSNELQTLQEQRSYQEEKLQELKKKIAHEDNQMAKLRGEIEDLKGMKLQLETKQAEQTELHIKDEDDKLDTLTHEIMKLICEKEDALESVEKVKEVYEAKVSEHESTIHELQRNVNVYNTELQEAQERLNETSNQASELQLSIQELQAKKEHDEQILLDDQARVVNELQGEIERYLEEISDLEDVVDEQQSSINKLKKKLLKKCNGDGKMNEAFKMQDR